MVHFRKKHAAGVRKERQKEHGEYFVGYHLSAPQG